MKKSTNNKDVPGRRQPGVHATPTSIAGTNGPIRDWLPALGLGRASRPGSDSGAANLGPAVDRWVKTVRAHGIRSVICLLSQEELDRYAHLPGGLLGRYEQLGLEARSIPVPADRTPVLTGEDRRALVEFYKDLPKPVLVHCSAGIYRSGAAVRYLKSLLADSVLAGNLPAGAAMPE